MKEKDGAEDDQEEIEGEKEPLDRGRHHARRGHSPCADGHGYGGDVGGRHRVLGGDPESDEEDAAQGDGKEGE